MSAYFNSKILARMWERVEQSKQDSDVAYFHDLMLLGEFLVKLLTSTVLASVGNDRDRQRYKVEYQLVRADGIGEWSRALEEVISGPANAYILPEARPLVRELTENFLTGEASWQRVAIDNLSAACQEIDSDLEQAARKTNLQWWVRNFATLRNRTRGHGAITIGKCSTAAPLLEVSILSLMTGCAAFSIPWIYLHRNISGKYRLSAISGNTSDFSYLKSEKDHVYTDGIHIAFGERLVRLPLLHGDVDIHDFYMANGGYKEGKGGTGSTYEALSYITDTRRRESAESYQTPPNSLPPSETEGDPDLDLEGKSFANIPPSLKDYIKRPDLESEVFSLLQDDRHPVVTLVGRGGIGKTSLALEVLHRVAQTGHYFAILWFSSRDIDLLPNGPKPVRPAVLSKEDIAKQFVKLMNPTEAKVKGFKAVDYLASALAERDESRRLLLVFDNFETASHPLELYQFIDSHVRCPNKVLITTRMRDFKADFPVEIRGMKRAEFEDLVMLTSRKLGIESLLTVSYVESLYEETDGHPYFVKILLGDTKREGKAIPVGRLFLNKEDSLRALFERSYGVLSPAAQRVFLTLSNWRSLVPRLALEAALIRPQNETMDVDDALSQLERYSMIEVLTDDDGSQFLRTPMTAAVFGQSKLKVSQFRPLVLADTQLIQQFGPMQVTDVSKGMLPRIERMIRVIASLRQSGKDYQPQIRALEYVAGRYPEAWLRIADFYLEGSRDDWGKARASIERLLELDETNVAAWRKLIYVNQRLGDALQELNARIVLAEMPDADYSEIANAASFFAHTQRNQSLQFDPEVRAMMISNLTHLMESRKTEATPTELSRLAWLYLYSKDVTKANEVVTEGLLRDPTNPHLAKLDEKLRESPEVS
ncbi:NB-ARC domain-containing protein [Streptomyces sp. NPDC056628]|uniref:tetratricopeptide repeat protein n=1 Tax=Streptomyces sp. NPDC056628 TaxID=3345882 RepID=UPI00369183C3